MTNPKLFEEKHSAADQDARGNDEIRMTKKSVMTKAKLLKGGIACIASFSSFELRH